MLQLIYLPDISLTTILIRFYLWFPVCSRDSKQNPFQEAITHSDQLKNQFCLTRLISEELCFVSLCQLHQLLLFTFMGISLSPLALLHHL